MKKVYKNRFKIENKKHIQIVMEDIDIKNFKKVLKEEGKMMSKVLRKYILDYTKKRMDDVK